MGRKRSKYPKGNAGGQNHKKASKDDLSPTEGNGNKTPNINYQQAPVSTVKTEKSGTDKIVDFLEKYGIALSIALTQLQTLFIAISIPVLLVTPYVMAKKLRNADGSCKVGEK